MVVAAARRRASARSRAHQSPLGSTSQHAPMATPPRDAGRERQAWQAASPGPFMVAQIEVLLK